MNSEKSFTVKNPWYNFWGCIGVIGLFIILVVLFTKFSPPPHVAMYVCVTILFFIPLTIVALWTKMYKVKVNGTNIHVRKCFGLVNFDLDIYDITNIEWNIIDTRYMQMDNITVFTSNGKSFKIGTFMVNLSEFIKLLEDNIEEDKINKIFTSFV